MNCPVWRCIILSVLIVALPSSVLAQGDESASVFRLDSVTVRGYRNQSPLTTGSDGSILWDLRGISVLPQIMGNADPMHYAQMLPGINTNNEYRSGINIQGCDNQHNGIMIEGVPLYNVSHLLGMFSTFNTPHYRTMSIEKGATSAVSENRLGGFLEIMHESALSDSVSGNVSLGLISSQGTLRLPLGRKTMLKVSARGSYINLLYSRWLKTDDQQISYSFFDANLTLIHQIDHTNTLLFDLYGGKDVVGFGEGDYLSDTKARWGNIMGAAHWLSKGDRWNSRTTAYVTSYRNKASLSLPDNHFALPSSITTLGLKNNSVAGRWSLGGELQWHRIEPQSVRHQGQLALGQLESKVMKSLEGSLYVNYDQPLGTLMKLSAGLRGSAFVTDGHSYLRPDPSLRLSFANDNIRWSATYAIRHQYLHQTGFSDMGLPTEFWLSSGEYTKPQWAHEWLLGGSMWLFQRRWSVSVDLFFRLLYNQLAYKGSLLDYMNKTFDIRNSLMHGRGRSGGFSVMVNKCTGRLTGWISYTYTRSRRTFDEVGRNHWYPAIYERPHELNMVMTYARSRHWTFGGTLVWASGTPFTQARSLMLLNKNLIINYGEYNAARLPSYMRVDLSANYKWGMKKGREHGLNLSIYNVFFQKNELFYFINVSKNNGYGYRPATFVVDMLPSLSYYYKF